MRVAYIRLQVFDMDASRDISRVLAALDNHAPVPLGNSKPKLPAAPSHRLKRNQTDTGLPVPNGTTAKKIRPASLTDVAAGSSGTNLRESPGKLAVRTNSSFAS